VLSLAHGDELLSGIPYDDCSAERAKTIRSLTGVSVGDSDALFGYTSPDTASLVFDLKGGDKATVETFAVEGAAGVSYFAVIVPGHESVTNITELAADGATVVKPEPKEGSCAAQA
jgi:hypothetical protein